MSRNSIQAEIGQNFNGRIMRSSKSRAAARVALGLAMGMVVAELSPAAWGQATWVGATSTDWNDPANWSSDPNPPSGNISIDTNTGNIATVTADSAFTPVDIFVGSAAGTNGQVNHHAGTVRTGNGNWMFVGRNGGGGVYNLSDTTTTGGTLTGFGTGSGSLDVGNGVAGGGRLSIGGGEFNGAGTGTLNINTTGSVNANNGLSVSLGHNAGGTGIVNLDNGTVNAGGEIWVGGSGSGTFNQAGGTVNNGTWFVVGRNNGGIGVYNLSGGTVNAATNDGFIVVGSFGGANGTINVSGGNLNSARQIYIGEGGAGTLNVTGGTVSAAHVGEGVRLGANTGGAGTVNLDGGTIQTPIVTQGAGSGTFNFNGGTLKATASNPNFMTGLTAVNVGNGGAIIDSNGFNVAIGDALLNNGTGGLTKNGAGTLTLGGASTYTGDTTVNDGTLALASGSSLTSNVTVAASKGFKAGTSTVSGLSFPGAADFTIDMGTISAPGNPAPLTISGTLALGSGNVVVNVDHTGTWGVGTYDLASAGSITGDTNQFVMGTVAGVGGRQSASLATTGSILQLTITGALPIWKGTASTNWSTNVADKPWDVNGADGEFIDGDVVRFDDTAAGSTNVNVVGTVNPALATFDNSTLSYTLSGSGSVGGTGSIVKNGSGSLTISTANTYSGGTTLNAGTLNINNANAIGTGALTVASGATIDNTSGSLVTLATNNAQTWNGDITFGGSNALNLGTGTITRAGSTTVTVNGTAPVTLGGTTNVTGTLLKQGSGTLAVGGTLTAGITDVRNGSLVVNSGGTLNNTGLDLWVGNNGGTGNLVINSGGTVNAVTALFGGNNTTGGTATVSNGGTLNTSAWLVVGFANGGSGTLDVNGGTINVRNNNTFGNLEVGTWDAATTGTVNLNGGSVNLLNNSSILMGVNGNQTGATAFNHNAGNVTFYGDNGTTVGGTGNLVVGNAGTGNHTYNLNGGTLSVGSVLHNGGTGTLNLNGGTLKATRNDANLITNLSAVNVGNGGAIIDTNGNNVRVTQPLLAGGTGGLTKNGAGTLRLGGGTSTYTGNTVINGGTLQLAPGTTATAVGVYSFDELAQGGLAAGTTVANTGAGGAAMNGTVNDAGHALGGGGASVVTGQFGNALSLDGLGSSVDIADRIVDQAGNGSWTMSTWVKTGVPGSTILAKNDANADWSSGDSIFYMASNPIAAGGGNLPTGVRWGGGFMQGNQNVVDSTWHMLTFVSNEGAKSIYVDGVLVPMSMTAFNNADPSTLVRLGFTHNTIAGDGTAHFAGEIDELKFFTGVLTASQIQSLFSTNTFTASSGLQYLPAGTAVSIPVSGAALDINGNDQTIGSLSGVAGTSVLLGAGTLTTGADNASTTFAGSIGGTGGLTKAGTGTMTLAGDNTYTGPTTATGGTLVLGKSLTTSSAVSVQNDAKVEVANDGTYLNVVKTPAITIGENARIDLKNNKLITDTPIGSFTGGAYTGVQGEVARAYNFGAWDLPGLTTSEELAGPNAGPLSGTTTIGVATGEQILFIAPTDTGTFAGQTVTGATTIAMYTYAGDMNFDGLVDAADYGVIDNWVQFPGTDGYANGDLNYDGVIDAADYGIIDNTIQLQGAPIPMGGAAAVAIGDAGLGGVTAVPEPASLGMLSFAAASLLGRRRRLVR